MNRVEVASTSLVIQPQQIFEVGEVKLDVGARPVFEVMSVSLDAAQLTLFEVGEVALLGGVALASIDNFRYFDGTDTWKCSFRMWNGTEVVGPE